MIIPRHKVCDICKEEVGGINKRYYIIKSRCLYLSYGGSARDNQTHHICENCMYQLTDAIHERLRANKDNDQGELEVI